jgi:hypothetical protein
VVFDFRPGRDAMDRSGSWDSSKAFCRQTAMWHMTRSAGREWFMQRAGRIRGGCFLTRYRRARIRCAPNTESEGEIVPEKLTGVYQAHASPFLRGAMFSRSPSGLFGLMVRFGGVS